MEALPANAIQWPKRMEVVARYMLLGNMRLVSEQMNISYPTLMEWKNSKWWPEVVQQLKEQKKTKTNSDITSLIDQSIDVMKDRLENGDFVFDQKTGQIVRKPVNIRDATQIATTLLQRQMQQEELEQRVNNSGLSVQDTLQQIANELKKYNKIEVIDVEDAKEVRKPTNLEIWLEKKKQNALHDQRQEGLQKGSGEVYESSGSNQETSGAEQSPAYDDESRESTQG